MSTGLYDPREHLRPRQKAFVDAYAANGGNQARAAEAAGYKGNVAKLSATGAQLLKKNRHVQAYLKLLGRIALPDQLATLEARRKFIADMVVDEELKPSERRKWMDMLCKSCGDYVIHVEQGGAIVHRIEVVRRQGAVGDRVTEQQPIDAEAEVVDAQSDSPEKEVAE